MFLVLTVIGMFTAGMLLGWVLHGIRADIKLVNEYEPKVMSRKRRHTKPRYARWNT